MGRVGLTNLGAKPEMLHIKTGTQNNCVDGKGHIEKFALWPNEAKKKDKLCLLDLGRLNNSIPSTSLIEF